LASKALVFGGLIAGHAVARLINRKQVLKMKGPLGNG